jgi:hypothetical protein
VKKVEAIRERNREFPPARPDDVDYLLRVADAARDALSWLSDAAPEVIDRTLRTLLDEEE